MIFCLLTFPLAHDAPSVTTACSHKFVAVAWQRPFTSCGVIKSYDVMFANSITGQEFLVRNYSDILYTISSTSPVLNIGARDHSTVQVHKGPSSYIKNKIVFILCIHRSVLLMEGGVNLKSCVLFRLLHKDYKTSHYYMALYS